MSFLFAALLANAFVSAPAPIIVSASPQQKQPAKTLSFDITMRHGDTLLWQGKLAMSSAGGAGFSQRRDQSVACAGPDGSASTARFATGFQLGLSQSYDTRTSSLIRVTARLDRPLADGPLTVFCEEQGQRSVEIQSTMDPSSGRPATFTGDGGFSVTITPR